MVAAEAAACGSPPLVARHSGLAEIAQGLRGGLPGGASGACLVRARGRRDLAAKLDAILSLPRSEWARLSAAARSAAVERWSWEHDCRSDTFAAWARPRSSVRKSRSALAREAFDAGKDLTVAVEEEFASSIPEPRPGQPLRGLPGGRAGDRARGASRRRADRLRGRGAHGALRDFADAAAVMVERRRQLLELAGRLDVALCGTGTHPWSPWQEQRIIDTPHYRRNDEVLRYVVWRNNTFGLHVHVGIKGADRAVLVTNALRGFLPELLAYSGSSPFVEACTRTCIPPAPRSSRGCSRAAESPTPSATGPSTRSTSAFSTTQVDHRAHAALVERPAAPRVPDRRAADLRRPAGARRVAGARSVDVRAHGADRARLDEGEPLPNHPHRLIEENFWRAIR